MGSFNSKHWTEGGTGLTNFRPEEEPQYLAAIAAYGDPAYIVSRKPMHMDGSIATDYSLHYLDVQSRKSSTPFWATFNKVNKES